MITVNNCERVLDHIQENDKHLTDEQAAAYKVIFDLCIQQGMKPDTDKSGLQNVVQFILKKS